MHVCKHIYTYIYMYINKKIFKFMFIFMYIYTYTYLYIHICTYNSRGIITSDITTQIDDIAFKSPFGFMIIDRSHDYK
jgi:hypothetical protein